MRARQLDRPSPGLSREPLFSASRHEASSLRRSAQFSTDCPIFEDDDSVMKMRGPGSSVEEVDALGGSAGSATFMRLSSAHH